MCFGVQLLASPVGTCGVLPYDVRTELGRYQVSHRNVGEHQTELSLALCVSGH